MTLPLVWLADVLRNAGLHVVEHDGWTTRTASGGPQPTHPVGVLEHHTATPTSYERPAPTVGLCINGRPDLAGPLCHAVIGYDGTVHVIAAGRANHAGKAKPSGPNPGGDGNALYVGFEWDYQGVNQGPSPEQYNAAVRATRAVLDRIGRPPEAARGHLETSVTGKIDPGRVDLEKFRRDVADNLEDDMNPEQDAILRRLEGELLGPRGSNGEIQGWGTEIGPRTVVAMLVDLVNALLAPKPSRAAGAEHILVPLPDAVRDTNGLLYDQLPKMISQLTTAISTASGDPSAFAEALRPVLSDVVGPVVRDAVVDALGEDHADQTEAVVKAMASRLAGQKGS